MPEQEAASEDARRDLQRHIGQTARKLRLQQNLTIAEIARKQGPVGLEKVETDEPFLAKGIRYVADGYDLEFIRDNLERDATIF